MAMWSAVDDSFACIQGIVSEDVGDSYIRDPEYHTCMQTQW